jgi:predicted amidohydrolase
LPVLVDSLCRSTHAVRVGACQTPEILGDPAAALRTVEAFAAEADARGVQLLLFPEGFLQGYLVTRDHVTAWAMELGGADFGVVLERLAPVRQTLVLGVLERQGARFFNTAVVVAGGRLLGAYRKVHLTAGEAIFAPGGAYPVFDVGGVRFGINICYDARFPRAAASVAIQGAHALLSPAQNMMRRENAVIWRDRHGLLATERARETGMWLVRADVTGDRDDSRTACGPTCIIDPAGRIVSKVPTGEIGMVTAEIAAAAAS